MDYFARAAETVETVFCFLQTLNLSHHLLLVSSAVNFASFGRATAIATSLC